MNVRKRILVGGPIGFNELECPCSNLNAFSLEFLSNYSKLKEGSRMPIGEKLWEETSKASGRRIRDCSEKGVSEEVSFAGQCRFSGRLEGRTARVAGTDDYLEKLNGDVMNGT